MRALYATLSGYFAVATLGHWVMGQGNYALFTAAMAAICVVVVRRPAVVELFD